jgi:glucosamine-6-phosphate isomerase
MEINIYDDYASLSKATAALIMNYVNRKSNSLICLASGHTPIGVFQELSNEIKAGNVDFSSCTFLSLDEWLGIDPNDSGSCLSMLKKDCFQPMNINTTQVEFFNVQANDLDEECNRINQLIAKNGGLDIMLVGVGINGHIGMNEPGTSFGTYAHVSSLAQETIDVGQKYFDKPTALSKGITLGLQHLRDSKLPIVMASGAKKAPIIGNALSLVTPTEEVPVSITKLIAQGYIMLDKDAAKYIK